MFCAICDHDVLLSGLQSHLRSHEVSLGQYTRVFGDPRKEIVAPVHHSCAICSQTLLLNTWDISRHLRRHNISFTKYARKHMKRGEVDDKPPESNSPLNQVTGRDVNHPAKTRSQT